MGKSQLCEVQAETLTDTHPRGSQPQELKGLAPGPLRGRLLRGTRGTDTAHGTVCSGYFASLPF